MCNHADGCHSGCEKFFILFSDNAPFLKIAIEHTSNSFNTSNLYFHVIVHIPCQATTIRDQIPPFHRHFQIHRILAPTVHLQIVTHWITYIYYSSAQKCSNEKDIGTWVLYSVKRGLKSKLKLNLSPSPGNSWPALSASKKTVNLCFSHTRRFTKPSLYTINAWWVDYIYIYTYIHMYASKYPNSSS